nr:CDP-glycerol glycerophosphotransferase family protein [uncultured Intestinibacter sp.]
MKKRLMVFTKYFKWLYKIYYYIGTVVINIFKIFVVPSDNIILFNSFGGKKFDDSPKAIYDAMILDSRFDKYELVWAFHEPDKFDIPRGKKIKTDTIQYYKIALKARCWISNSSIERGLNFKGKNTYYFNTFHGTPIKIMGTDINTKNKSFGTKNMESIVDNYTSQSKYEADIFSRVFNTDRDKFLIYGLPRNDKLANYSKEEVDSIKRKLSIPFDKKIILYAPTFREYERNSKLECVIDMPIDLTKWEKQLGDKYIFLLRAHYEVAEVLNVKENSNFVYDVSDYKSLNDLMIISDLLISDYSSIFFDYSIMNKPMICYTYDYEKYSENRGMYFDIRDELEGGSLDENSLIDKIKNLNIKNNLEYVKTFRNKYVENYGNATQLSLDKIYENIK